MAAEAVDLVSRRAEIPVSPHRISVAGWAGTEPFTLLLREVLLAAKLKDQPVGMRQQQDVRTSKKKTLFLSRRIKLFDSSGVVREVPLRQKRRDGNLNFCKLPKM